MDKNVIWGIIFSAIVSYIIPKTTPKIDQILDTIWSFIFKVAPKNIIGYFKLKRKNKLIDIRKKRYNQDAVMFQTIKAHSYFILFWCVIGFYILLIALTPLKFINKENPFLFFLIISPIFAFELLWLIESEKAKVLIKHRGRVTRK